jgi:hypothetical protein
VAHTLRIKDHPGTDIRLTSHLFIRTITTTLQVTRASITTTSNFRDRNPRCSLASRVRPIVEASVATTTMGLIDACPALDQLLAFNLLLAGEDAVLLRPNFRTCHGPLVQGHEAAVQQRRLLVIRLRNPPQVRPEQQMQGLRLWTLMTIHFARPRTCAWKMRAPRRIRRCPHHLVSLQHPPVSRRVLDSL